MLNSALMPFYVHQVLITSAGTNQVFINALIIDKSGEKIDTLAKLKAKMQTFTLPFLNVGGSLLTPSYYCALSYLETYNNKVYLRGKTSTDVELIVGSGTNSIALDDLTQLSVYDNMIYKP